LYKLAIFDFDGTLVDSAPGIVDVMRQCVDEYTLPHTVLEEWRVLIGVPLMRQMEIVFPDSPEEYWLEVATRYREIYDAKTIELCPLFPGLTKMLDALQKAEIKISIATSKRRPLVEVVLKHHDLMKYFDLLVGAQDVSNHKPHPESVHITLDRLNVAPDDAVVIGDSTYDLDMARNAGVDAIGVTTGVHSEVILSKSEPKHIVAGLEDVLKIILNGRNGKLTH